MSIASSFSLAAHNERVPPDIAEYSGRVRAVVLLNGTTGPAPFAAQVGRSLLDLPLGGEVTALKLWRRQLDSLETHTNGQPDVRLVLSIGVTAPQLTDEHSFLRIERDPLELRGTGGVLRDVTEDYPDDAMVLVATAAQVLLSPLAGMIEQLVAARSDVAMFVHDDGSPAGLMLVRRGCLRSIPRVGFVDLKEQALPQIARVGSVSAIRAGNPVTASIRTLGQYIRALRLLHPSPTMKDEESATLHRSPAFAEQWQPAFKIVEPAAQVDSGAHLHDSVILAGGKVGAGAAVIRSVVALGGVVSAGATVVDQVIGGPAMKVNGISLGAK